MDRIGTAARPLVSRRAPCCGGDWAGANADEVDQLERLFIEASISSSESELRHAHRTNSRLRTALIATGLLLTASVSLTAFAVHQRSTARAAREAAQSARNGSDALRFGAEAETVEDPSLAMSLVAQALTVQDSDAGRQQAVTVFGRFRSLVSTGQRPAGTDWPDGVDKVAGGHSARSPDGSVRAEAVNNAIRPINAASGAVVGVIGALPGTPNALTFDPAGGLLAAGFSEVGFATTGTTVVWHVAHRSEVARFDAGDGQVWAHWFAPDSGSIYTDGADGLHQWDLAGTRAIARTGAGEPVFFRGGNVQLSMSDDSVDAWIAEACRLAARPISEDEWQTFVGDVPYEPAC